MTVVTKCQAGTQPLITTNGMFIIDKIVDQNQEIHEDVAGGGGMFAMLGGCIVSLNSKMSRSLKWIVDCGYDFPSGLMEEIQGWESGAVFRHDDSRGTTRGCNYYSGELREFTYLSPKKTICARDWEVFGEEELERIECIHLVCSTERYEGLVGNLSSSVCHPATVVWEPLPDICNPAHLDAMKKILLRDDGFAVVFSPNAEEGARLLAEIEPFTVEEASSLIRKYDAILADRNSCVLRCGKLGSVTLTPRDPITNQRSIFHHPAYHEKSPEKVIDPTGGGNSFLGGFCLGYTATHDLKIANVCGNIAAGCVVEQVGVPRLGSGSRKWNGLTFRERLANYLFSYPQVADKTTEIVCQELTYRWN